MEVFVLTLQFDHEGGEVLGVYIRKSLAMLGAMQHLTAEDDDYKLGEWSSTSEDVTEVDRLWKVGSEYRRAGTRADSSYCITKYPLVQYTDQV